MEGEIIFSNLRLFKIAIGFHEEGCIWHFLFLYFCLCLIIAGFLICCCFSIWLRKLGEMYGIEILFELFFPQASKDPSYSFRVTKLALSPKKDLSSLSPSFTTTCMFAHQQSSSSSLSRWLFPCRSVYMLKDLKGKIGKIIQLNIKHNIKHYCTKLLEGKKGKIFMIYA